VRVKGKNFRDFCGKPLFRWIFDTLLTIEEIDQIIINTDARHILAQNGLVSTDLITIRDRKSEICGDNVSMNKVLADDIANAEADMYIMTHATNPFLSRDTIKKAIATFTKARNDGNADSLFSVDRFQKRFYRADCIPINHNPKVLLPTQELESWYAENSCLYIFTAQSFATTNARIGSSPMMLESPPIESVDIDTQDDWNLALSIAKSLAL